MARLTQFSTIVASIATVLMLLLMLQQAGWLFSSTDAATASSELPTALQ